MTICGWESLNHNQTNRVKGNDLKQTNDREEKKERKYTKKNEVRNETKLDEIAGLDHDWADRPRRVCGKL